jgi:hypothetical protein
MRNIDGVFGCGFIGLKESSIFSLDILEKINVSLNGLGNAWGF